MPRDPHPDPELPPPPDGAKPVPDPCPACGATHCLHIVERLTARPLTSASLAGVQTKATARPAIVLECRACRASAPLTVDPGGARAHLPDPSAMRPPPGAS